MRFLSSGGLGDAWLIFLKILDHKPEEVHWEHLCGHDIHVDPITELMTLMPRITYGKCHRTTKDTRPGIEESIMSRGAKRLDTKAPGIQDPTPNLPFFQPSFKEDLGDYVVVQPAAGRPDNSYRCFMPYAVMELIEHFGRAGKKTVLLGAEFKGATPKGVVNLTNKTAIKTAIEIIKGAQHFVGFDGFLSYVAMALKIPSFVVFHDPRLPLHYMHPDWNEHAKWLVGPQRISDGISTIIEQC